MAPSLPTYPGGGDQHGVRYAGGRVEGGQQGARRLLGLVAEQGVAGERETGQQSAHVPYVHLEHRQLGVLSDTNGS